MQTHSMATSWRRDWLHRAQADKAAAGVPKKARKAPAAAVAEQQPACSEAAQQRTGVVAPTHAADQGPCAATAGCADNLRVQVAPRDNPTAVAVHKCREEVVVDTLLRCPLRSCSPRCALSSPLAVTGHSLPAGTMQRLLIEC